MKVEKCLSSIDHLGILVRDLDKTVKLFSDLFEMEFENPHDTPDADIRESMEPGGINLYEPLAPERSKNPGAMAKNLDRWGEGVNMVSFKVPNLEEAVTEMQAKGLRLISSFTYKEIKIALFHPKDTFGITIELCEYKAKHPAS